MTRDDAVAVARDLAAARGWSWREPVQARLVRAWWVGPQHWHVVSNSGAKGGNVRVEIDAATGRVLRATFIAR